jgi:glutamate racemase
MENQNTASIGIFDSGLGGLTILSEIKKRLPFEDIIYLADSKNAPYGEKTPQQIIELSKTNTDFLLSKNCKLIVVACNTATTNAIDVLRRQYKVPFVGIEPAIKPAILNSKNAKVGVLATKGTLSSSLFAKTTQRFKNNTHVIEVVGKGIVEAIEANNTNSKHFDEELSRQLLPFINEGIDTLVLGCSHYPFIISQIKKHIGENVNIIDSGFAVAKQTERLLQDHNLLFGKQENHGKLTIYSNQTSQKALNQIIKNLELSNVEVINN